MIFYDRKAWFRLLVSRRGTFERGVLAKVLAFGAWAGAVWAVDHFHVAPVRMTIGLHEIAGVVIGLILAFRTNTAYARFWEGRTLWGGIVNSSRNLARIVDDHSNQTDDENRVFRGWIVAFAHATRCRLRGLVDVREAADILSQEDYDRLHDAAHRPLLCAAELSRRLSQLVGRGGLDPMIAAVAERQVNALVDYLGGCERIWRTPTPLPYVLLMQRGVFLYLVTLPSALLGRLEELTPFVTMAVAYLVLMIETISTELDNPFGTEDPDIPLDRICATIAFDLLRIGECPVDNLQRGVGTVEQ